MMQPPPPRPPSASTMSDTVHTLAKPTSVSGPTNGYALHESFAQDRVVHEPKENERNIIKRLRSFLNKAESKGHASILAWLPHGRSFKVYNRELFAKEVLPYIMDTDKFSSFQRLLRRWGFIQIQQGPDQGAYYNQYFLRDEPELCKHLKPDDNHDLSTTAARTPMAGTSSSRMDSNVVKRSMDGPVATHLKMAATATSSKGTAPTKRKPEGPMKKKRGRDAQMQQPSKRVQKTNAKDNDCMVVVDPTKQPSGPAFLLNEDHAQGSVPGLLFPWQMHDMLDDAEDDEEMRKIVSWQPDGVSFTIRSKDIFSTKILPKYFQEASWDEFITNLSSWGFVRFTSGAQKGAFIHRLLVRGKRSLCKQMRINGKTVSILVTVY